MKLVGHLDPHAALAAHDAHDVVHIIQKCGVGGDAILAAEALALTAEQEAVNET